MTRYGFIKPALDAHTLGLSTIAQALKSCGADVVLAPYEIEKAIECLDHPNSRSRFFAGYERKPSVIWG